MNRIARVQRQSGMGWFLGPLLLVLALLAIGAPERAFAAAGDACFLEDGTQGAIGDPNPDDDDDTLVCVAGGTVSGTFPQGSVCDDSDSTGLTLYWSGSSCVANNTTAGCPDGQFYTNGVCTAPPTPPTPDEVTVVTTPSAFTEQGSLNVGFSGAPGTGSGRQSTLCVNASPFVGGGVFVVSGTVLCYTGDAAMTNVYAYQTSEANISAGGVTVGDLNTSAWQGLTAQDFWATRNITAQGSLIAQGGAFISGGDTQILSDSGKVGMEVTNSGTLIGAFDGNDTATFELDPGSIVMTTGNGTDTAQIGMSDASGTMTISQTVSGGTDSTGTSITRTTAETSSTDGTSTSFTRIQAAEVTSSSTDGGDNTTYTRITPTQLYSQSVDGTNTTFERMEADGVYTSTTDGVGGNTTYTQITPTQLYSQSFDGTNTTFERMEADGVYTSTSDGTETSTLSLDPEKVEMVGYDRTLIRGGQSDVAGYSGSLTLGDYAPGDAPNAVSGASMRGVFANSPVNTGEVSLGTETSGARITGDATNPAGSSTGVNVVGNSAGSGDAIAMTGTATGSGEAVSITGIGTGTGASAISLTGTLTGAVSVPSILIDGVAPGSTSDPSTLRSRTGVLVTGSGNADDPDPSRVGGTGDGVVSEAGVANWADVAIMSRNYENGAPFGLGTAIIVNDYGIDVTTAPLVEGQNDRSLNTIASGAGNTVGTFQVNRIGEGGPGTVTNEIGHGGPQVTSETNNTIGLGGGGRTNNTIGSSGAKWSRTTNTIGQGGPGTVVNAIGNSSPTETGRMENSFGNGGAGMVTNTIGSAGNAGTEVINRFGQSGEGRVFNFIGTGDVGYSRNYIGNDDPRTNINMDAAGSGLNMRNGILVATVRPLEGMGGSVLPGASGRTSGYSGTVLRGAEVDEYVAVDANGRLSMVAGPVFQSTAAMVLTNGYGNVHGLLVNERQATLSGGTRSASLTLDDGGARFGHASDGTPVRVTGVAEGQAPYDAVNVRQFHRAIAAAVAITPQIDLKPGESGIGVGVGGYGVERAIGIGYSYLGENNLQINLAASHAGGRRTAWRSGVGLKW